MKISVILLFLIIWIADAKNDNYKHTFNQPGKSAELKCPDDEIIYNVTLTTKNNKYKCYGLQVSVLVATLKCYWKNGCNVTLEKNDIISQTDDFKCIGKIPDVMHYNFSCIPKDAVTHSVHVIHATITSPNGIIKSHNKYPWNYEPEPSGITSVGSATIRKPKHKKILYMKYINYDVHFTDKVTISYNKTAVELWDHGLKVIKDMKNVHLNFTVCPGTKFGGFLICYKWVRSTSDKEEREFEMEPCTSQTPPSSPTKKSESKKVQDPTHGSITGPIKLTIKKPCKRRKGCKKSWRKLKFLRFGIIESSGEIQYKFTTRRKGKAKETNGSFDGRSPFKVKTGILKRMKEIEIDVPDNTQICFVWEAKPNSNPVDCP